MASIFNPIQGYAPAKINLFLEVTGKRADGFHNIDSVFTEIDMHDSLHVENRDDDSIFLETVGMEGDMKGNLVYKAVDKFKRQCGVKQGLTMRLEKSIPAGSGLGGGSSDAALALKLADQCWNTGLGTEELKKIGAEIGSDVAFFFHGGICVCRGRGEIVTPVTEWYSKDICLVLALTGIHCDTASAYRGLQLPEPGRERHSEEFVQALVDNDEEQLEKLAFNRFEPTVFKAYPKLGQLRDQLSDKVGREVRLSGSGGSLWFFARPDDAEDLFMDPGIIGWALENDVRLQTCKLGGG